MRQSKFARTVERLALEFLEDGHNAGLFPSALVDRAEEAVGDSRILSPFCSALRAAGDRTASLKGVGDFRLHDMRELDGSTRFLFLQYRPKRRRRSLKCFVGHRFERTVTRALRWNLLRLLEPLTRQPPTYAGLSLLSADLLRSIERDIKAADFCLFDNRGTLNKPNVYIEAGMAYALNKPMIFFEFEGTKAPEDTGSMPTDFSGILTLRYKSYKKLFKALHLGLPKFIRDQV